MVESGGLRYSMVAYEAIHKGYGQLVSQLAQFVANAQVQTQADLAAAQYGRGQDGAWTRQLFEDQARKHQAALKKAGEAVESWFSLVAESHEEAGRLDQQAGDDFKATAEKIRSDREGRRGAE